MSLAWFLARRLSCKCKMKQSLPGCQSALLDAIFWPTRIGQVVNVSIPNLSSPSAQLQPLIHWIFTYFRRVVAVLQWFINKVWPSSKSKSFWEHKPYFFSLKIHLLFCNSNKMEFCLTFTFGKISIIEHEHPSLEIFRRDLACAHLSKRTFKYPFQEVRPLQLYCCCPRDLGQKWKLSGKYVLAQKILCGLRRIWCICCFYWPVWSTHSESRPYSVSNTYHSHCI